MLQAVSEPWEGTLSERVRKLALDVHRGLRASEPRPEESADWEERIHRLREETRGAMRNPLHDWIDGLENRIRGELSADRTHDADSSLQSSR
jgi:hypothetical protein